jgi:hypothetical protein
MAHQTKKAALSCSTASQALFASLRTKPLTDYLRLSPPVIPLAEGTKHLRVVWAPHIVAKAVADLRERPCQTDCLRKVNCDLRVGQRSGNAVKALPFQT